MTATARTKAATAVVALGALLVMLLLLSGALDQLTFRPGNPLPREAPAEDVEIEQAAPEPAPPTDAIGRIIGIVTLSTVCVMPAGKAITVVVLLVAVVTISY